MKLQFTGLLDKDYEKEIKVFLKKIGERNLEKLLKNFDDTEEGFYKTFFLIKRNPLIEGMKTFQLLQTKNKSIWKHRTKSIDYLASIAFTINRIYSGVNEIARKHIIGRLKCDDLRPFLFEIESAFHFLMNGYDVNFVEYEKDAQNGKTFDFLVSKNGIEGEVECKWKSIDIGRKIPSQNLYIFSDLIKKELSSFNLKVLIELKCRNRLQKNQDDLADTAGKIKEAIERNLEEVSSEDFFINLKILPDNLEIVSEKEIANIIEPYLTEKSHFTIVRDKKVTIIIKVESEKRDEVLNRIFNDLKISLKQFSGRRAALIRCHLDGVDKDDWEQLLGKTGIAIMTSNLIGRKDAKHIHTVSYTSGAKEVEERGTVSQFYPSLFYKNPECIYFPDKDVFTLSNAIE